MVPFMVHTGSREVADAVYGDLYQAVYQQSYFKAEMQRASYIRVNQLGVADLKVESCVDIGTCVFPAGAEEGEKKGNINRTVAIVVPVMLVLVLLAGFFAWRYHRLRRNTQMKLRMLSNMQSVNASPGQFQANNELFALAHMNNTERAGASLEGFRACCASRCTTRASRRGTRCASRGTWAPASTLCSRGRWASSSSSRRPPGAGTRRRRRTWRWGS